MPALVAKASGRSLPAVQVFNASMPPKGWPVSGLRQ
jgi:hypothetical protein